MRNIFHPIDTSLNNTIGISSSNKFKRLFLSVLLKYAHSPHCGVHSVLERIITQQHTNDFKQCS